MSDILDVNPLQRYMALFVGGNGSGKSIALSSFPKPIFNFDFDGRMASVAQWAKRKGTIKPGEFQFETYGPQNLYDAMKKLDSFVDSCPYGTIAIDSFTAVTISAVMFSLRRRENSDKAGNRAARSKGDMILPDWDEYKGETVCVTQMLDLCKAIAASGTAVIWTAHPVQSTKIVGKEYSIQTRYVAYGGKSDSLVPIYFNEIYNFTTEWDPNTDSIQRVCLTQPMAGVNAKTALGLPKRIEWTDKDFYPLFKKLAQEGTTYDEVKTEEKTDDDNDSNIFKL